MTPLPSTPEALTFQSELALLRALETDFEAAGKSLMERCDGSIFPSDLLVLTALSRAISLTDGFVTLAESDNFDCAANLVRLQLDNVLRIYGVTTCSDPHGIAKQVLAGAALSTLEHNDDGKMKDRLLVELLGRRNPWLRQLYKDLSGFIHLSSQHFSRLLAQSTQDQHGVWTLLFSSRSTHMSGDEKRAVVRHFHSITHALIGLVEQWTAVRRQFGTTQELIERFG